MTVYQSTESHLLHTNVSVPILLVFVLDQQSFSKDEHVVQFSSAFWRDFCFSYIFCPLNFPVLIFQTTCLLPHSFCLYSLDSSFSKSFQINNFIMPHAKTQAAHTNGINNEKTMASTQVTNGDGPQSQFLSVSSLNNPVDEIWAKTNSKIAPYIIPSRLRWYLNLQVKPIRRQIAQPCKPPHIHCWCQLLQANFSISGHSYQLCSSIRCKSRFSGRPRTQQPRV